MAKRNLPTPQHVRNAVSYDHINGVFYYLLRTPDMFSDGKYSAKRKCETWNAQYAGREAFRSKDRLGYKRGQIFGRVIMASWVAFVLMTGRWPDLEIDHINGDRCDNRWVNLREVTKSENARNRRRRINSKSPYNGVRLRPSGNWQVRISTDKGEKHLGTFSSLQEAIMVRKEAERQNGYHRNHGR